MTITRSRQPDIKSNWWRLVVFFLLVFIGVGICYIPIFLLNPDLLSIPRDEFNRAFDSHRLEIAGIAAMCAGAFFATYIMLCKIEYRTLRSVRFTFNFKELIYGGAFALIIFCLFALAVYSFQLVKFTYQGVSLNLFYSLLLYALVAFNEELIFRGYVLHNLLEKMNPALALLFSSILFGLVHYGNDHFTWFGCLTISLSGFLMGLLVLKGGSLSAAMGCHWVWNFVQGPVFGFEVSGRDEHGIFKTELISNNEILTGGSFGGEGSVILTGITAVIVFLVWIRIRKTLQNPSIAGN